MTKPQFGDVIFIKKDFLLLKKIYHHYGVYVDDNEVWHYDQKSESSLGKKLDNLTCNGIIRSTSYEEFHEGHPVYICRFNELVIDRLYKIEFIDLNIYKTLMLKLASFLPAKAFVTFFVANFIFNAHNKAQNTYTEEHRAAMHLFSPKETVERARQCRDMEKYNLIFNNCEHFAIWCKTGVKESIQVEKLQEILMEYAVASSF